MGLNPSNIVDTSISERLDTDLTLLILSFIDGRSLNEHTNRLYTGIKETKS